jgi:hypothetical protein
MEATSTEVERAVAAEREACARIAEEALRQLAHGHGAEPYGVVCAIVEGIRARAQPPSAGEPER